MRGERKALERVEEGNEKIDEGRPGRKKGSVRSALHMFSAVHETAQKVTNFAGSTEMANYRAEFGKVE